MSTYNVNPFQKSELSVPEEYHEFFVQYCQTRTDGLKTNIDKSPFRRMVDLWFLAVCVAVHQGLKPVDLAGKKTKKIIDGTIFSSDPWRINALMLMAVGYEGKVDILTHPNEMMKLANNLAIAGLPVLVEMLKDGPSDPIWNLSDNILS
ncbi:MAG: hypothetical protein HOG49_28860 [Candidatus Scalindua sp.]|jgi:hypothetical protein|nr:hypothetical protein [Candidatus Scalindua sp.]